MTTINPFPSFEEAIKAIGTAVGSDLDLEMEFHRGVARALAAIYLPHITSELAIVMVAAAYNN